jgi:pilus assembly protein CpaC
VIVGKGTILTIKEPSKRVSVSDPAIAEINLISPTQILINGKKVGATTLITWDIQENTKFFDLRVTGDIDQLKQQIKELAPNDDIKVEFANDTIVLSGRAANQQTINKVVQLAQAHAVASEVKTTTTYAGGIAKELVETSAKVLNHIRIDEPQQVLLEVRVAQVDKSKLKEFGLSSIIEGRTAEGFINLTGFAPSGEREVVAPEKSSKAEGIAGNIPGLASIKPLNSFQLGVSYFPGGIGSVLKALSTKNLAKILAEPNLLVKSGQTGSFLAGSKIPIAVVKSVGGIAGTEIVFIDVGIKLNFAPEVTENGMIFLKIDPAEVSTIAGTLAINGYPIIDTREVRTGVELKNGESLILAGLLQEDAIKTMSKIPILGDIPILGALFRSTQNDLKEKELVFFISPKIIKPIPQGVKTELPGEKPLTPEEEREFQWIPLPRSSSENK